MVSINSIGLSEYLKSLVRTVTSNLFISVLCVGFLTIMLSIGSLKTFVLLRVLITSYSILTINLIVNWLKSAEFPVFLWVNIDSTIDERFDWNVFENVRCGDNLEKYFSVVSKEQMSYFSHLNFKVSLFFLCLFMHIFCCWHLVEI